MTTVKLSQSKVVDYPQGRGSDAQDYESIFERDYELSTTLKYWCSCFDEKFNFRKLIQQAGEK